MSSKKNDSGLSLPWINNSTNLRIYGKVLCFMDRGLHPISSAWHINRDKDDGIRAICYDEMMIRVLMSSFLLCLGIR